MIETRINRTAKFQDIRLPKLLDSIGHTPLIEIKTSEINNPNVTLLGKAEFMNPGGSVKDRAALNIIKEAIKAGLLDNDKTLLDASSGNTGIAYAMVGASLGIKVKICIPKNASKERLTLLKAYGASIELTDPLEGTDGAILKAREIYEQEPSRYYYADQYSNPANWKAHYLATGTEIFDQTQGSISHFIAGLGTSGTFVGSTRRLKELNPHIEAISFQPDSPFHGLEGLKHMQSALIPKIYDENLADENIFVKTEQAYKMTKELAQKQGLLVGISSGASVAAAIQLAKTIDEGVIVTILADRGDRYLSENIWRID